MLKLKVTINKKEVKALSYCVNCGVELDKSAKKCPLCNTPVINPNEAYPKEPEPKPFADTLYIPDSTGRKYITAMVSIALLVPNIICCIVGLILKENLSWTLYVNASSLLAFILFMLPFMYAKPHPYAVTTTDTVAVSMFVFFIYRMSSVQNKWFSQTALPIIVFMGILILFYFLWNSRSRHQWQYKVIFWFVAIALYSIVLEALIWHFLYSEFSVHYSLIVVASSFALSIFFAAIAKSKKMKEWFDKRTHI